MAPSEGQHPDLDLIKEYLESGVGGVLSIDGWPQGQLVVMPRNQKISLRFHATSDEPHVVDYENLQVRTVVEASVRWHEMTVDVSDSLGAVYAVMCSLIDRVQSKGQHFGHAIVEVLESLSELLSQRTKMSISKQIGLFGELATVRAIAGLSSGPAAVEAWRGTNEEHDFGLEDVDLEVKSTLGESRTHWISSATQLAPTGKRPLLLLSIQLTTAGAHTGASLPELVSRVRDEAGAQLEKLNRTIHFTGYRDKDAELYRARWALRTAPVFFYVDESFPAITRDQLDNVVPSPERVTDIRYRINLHKWPPALAPFFFDDVL